MTRWIHTVTLAILLAAALALPGPVRAGSDFHGFSEAQLDQMLAPVALYPDTVLSHVLIAATYPLEVVQAARWSRNNPDLRGDRALDAVVGQDWDPSVMALVAFPNLLARMDSDLDWTQMLGDAFLAQEEQVLDSIQRLRAQAHQSGHLDSNEHVRVVREREVIYIEPARRQVVYVPYYDPRVVYGHWRWASYPPVYWRHPPRQRASVAFYWGPAYHVAPAFFFSSFHWSRRQVVVVNHHHHYYHPRRHARPVTVHNHFYNGRDLARHDSAQRWQHRPTHRRGVAYRHDVPERHRQQATPARSRSANTSGAAARTSSSRSDQRAWADTRRESNLLGAQSRSTRGSAQTRSPATRSQPGQASQSSRQSRSANSSERRIAGSVEQNRRTARHDPAATRSSLRDAQRASQRSSQAATTRSRPAQSAPPRTGTTVRQSRTEGAVTRRSSSPQRSGSSTRSAPSRASGSVQADRRAATTRSTTSRQRSTAPSTQRSVAPRSSTPSSQRSSSTRASAPPSRTQSTRATAPRSSATQRISSNRSARPSASRSATSSRRPQRQRD